MKRARAPCRSAHSTGWMEILKGPVAARHDCAWTGSEFKGGDPGVEIDFLIVSPTV